MAVNYILALKPNLEAKDIRGLTPLHLSINRIERNGSARIMKTLLLKGANRLSEDYDQKTPD
jgi:ankyrin repeat protein